MSPKPISKEPQHRWRTLPSHGRSLFADTEEDIIAKARRQAEELGTSVSYELWSEDHPQDHLNEGWAMVGTVHYETRLVSRSPGHLVDVLMGPPAKPRCPVCGHAPHETLAFCPNMASDNDCSCTYGVGRELAKAQAAGVLPMHEFVVTVAGCSLEEAEQVLNERLNHDEDYGFDYEIGWRKA